jgi:hypothetical protein
VVANKYCVVFCFVFPRLVWHMLPVSLDFPFLIAPSVFSNVYYADYSRSASTAQNSLYLIFNNCSNLHDFGSNKNQRYYY